MAELQRQMVAVGAALQASPIQAQVAVLMEKMAAAQGSITNLSREISKMATQADVDALTARLTALDTRTTNAVAAIKQEIANLQSANPALDLTALTTAVGTLETDTGSVEALETPPPPA